MIMVPRWEFTLILSDERNLVECGNGLHYPVEFVGNERKVYLEEKRF